MNRHTIEHLAIKCLAIAGTLGVLGVILAG